MASDKSINNKRTRNFATVVYPDSAPDNWQEILINQFVQSFISPLHDKDLDPDGNLKKPHWHVLIMFDSVKTVEQAKEFFSLIGGVGMEIVQSARGYARYLCHMDNPEKFQYNPEQVRSLCGADYLSLIGLAIDKYKAITDIVTFCRYNGITEYCDLFDYCVSERSDWLRVLCDNGTYVVERYLRSFRFKSLSIDDNIPKSSSER